MTLLALATLCSALGASPEVVAASLEKFNALAHEPLPKVEGKDFERLMEGNLIRIRVKSDDPDAPQRVVGLQLIPATKEELWVSTHDEHYVDVEEITSAYVGELNGRALWYQHLAAPWPFTDRHWVIEVWDNLEVVEGTGGAMWEHPWDLPEGGPVMATAALRAGKVPNVTEEMGDKCIYTPVNHGAWVAIDVGDATVLAYHVTSVVGGGIPDGLVARFSMHSLKRIFGEAIERLDEIRGHYDLSHERITGGDGQPIAPFAEVALTD